MKRYMVEMQYHDHTRFWYDRGFCFRDMAIAYTERICSENDKVRQGRVLDLWSSLEVVWEW